MSSGSIGEVLGEWSKELKVAEGSWCDARKIRTKWQGTLAIH